MKAENELFISVIVREDAISVVGSYDYTDAKDNMVNMLNVYFNPQTDEGIIYKFDKPGTTEAVFNYRAHLNKEADHYVPSQKANKNIKIFFECPKCHGHKFKIVPDEDGDFLANCSNCNHYELIQQ